jgi:hypothetical protein
MIMNTNQSATKLDEFIKCFNNSFLLALWLAILLGDVCKSSAQGVKYLSVRERIPCFHNFILVGGEPFLICRPARFLWNLKSIGDFGSPRAQTAKKIASPITFDAASGDDGTQNRTRQSSAYKANNDGNNESLWHSIWFGLLFGIPSGAIGGLLGVFITDKILEMLELRSKTKPDPNP